MTILDFKKTGRILKKIYEELEKEAIESGVVLDSEEYNQAQEIIRNETLKKLGYTAEEYQQAKQEYLDERKKKSLEPVESLKQELKKDLGEIKIPTTEEIKETAKSVIPPPQIIEKTINKIQKIIEKPTIIEKTEIVNVPFDPNPLYTEIGYLKNKIDDIKIPPEINTNLLKEEIKDEIINETRTEFGENLKHNIDILGMPDFRKLAMGLKNDIDNISLSWGSITGTLSNQTDLQTALDTKVPYTGATADVDLGNYNLLGGAITLPVRIDVKEENTSAISKGQACCISGSSGTKIRIGLANNITLAKIRIIGLASDAISQNGDGIVVNKGLLTGVDTRITNLDVNPNAEVWAEGDALWLANISGGMTNARPVVGRSIKVGYTVKGNSNTDEIIVDAFTNPVWVTGATGEDVILRVGDTEGVNKVSIRDYADVEVVSIDSNGSGRFSTGIKDNAETPLLSIDTGARKLYASDGSTLGLDYSLGGAISAGGAEIPTAGSNFFGPSAGYYATNATNSNFFGNGAGYGATNASNSSFFGINAGSYATNATGSNFFGDSAGYGATNAVNSNFFGQSAGYQATEAIYSNFFGQSAGYGAISAAYSNFFGPGAGVLATDAYYSNFFGVGAGYGATYASYSNFFGISAGSGAIYAKNSIFLGASSGYSDTVDNTNGVIITINPIPDTAGSGYTVNDILSITSGDSMAKIKVESIDGEGGVVTFVKINSGEGGYTVSGFNTTFGGTGTGCTVEITSVTTGTANGTSIAIGRYSGTGGFSDSIAIGHGVINSATLQANIGNVLYLTGIYNSDEQSSTPMDAGKVGIGTASPTAVLHLKASTVSADTASMKIDAGVVATTPVSGNIESDGTHLYWTDSGGTRRQLDN